MEWQRTFRQIRYDPLKVSAWLIGAAYRACLMFNPRVRLGKGVRIIGRPIIDVRRHCRISIGDNVLLNSRNRGYFGPLYGPVKLFADSDGASISIGHNTRIHGSCLHSYNRIDIGKNCLIAANTVIVDSDGHDPFPADLTDRLAVKKEGIPVVIEDNVWIGLNCVILKGVHIGEGAIIGAGSVVRDSVAPRSLVIGNPAQVVKRLATSTPH